MKAIKNFILKTIAIIAVTGLTVCGSAVPSSANARTGSGGHQSQGTSDTINRDSGSGTGGSTDTETPDTGSGYHNYQQPSDTGTGSSYRNDQQPSDSTGSGTGGSTDTDTGPTRSMGTGPNYGTAPLGGPSGNGMGDTTPEK